MGYAIRPPAGRAGGWLLALALAVLCLASCGGGEEGQGTSGASTQSGSSHETAEESVESFGEEASGQERERIIAAQRGYLEALGAHDYAAACAKLSAQARESIASLAAKRAKPGDCGRILPGLFAPTAAAIARQQADGDVTRVRIEGDQGFVIFHAPGAKLYIFTLEREGAQWKGTAITASILVPLPAIPE